MIGIEAEVPGSLASRQWLGDRGAWRARAAAARTVRDLADCLADLEAGLGLTYPANTELADRCSPGPIRAVI